MKDGETLRTVYCVYLCHREWLLSFICTIHVFYSIYCEKSSPIVEARTKILQPGLAQLTSVPRVPVLPAPSNVHCADSGYKRRKSDHKTSPATVHRPTPAYQWLPWHMRVPAIAAKRVKLRRDGFSESFPRVVGDLSLSSLRNVLLCRRTTWPVKMSLHTSRV